MVPATINAIFAANSDNMEDDMYVVLFLENNVTVTDHTNAISNCKKYKISLLL